MEDKNTDIYLYFLLQVIVGNVENKSKKEVNLNINH